MEIKDISYSILMDDDNKVQYFLDNEPWEFVDPTTVKVGDIVYFDPNGLDRYGIVMNIRNEDFIYYDVSQGHQMNLEEIAMFQVYKVDRGVANG